MDRRAYEADKEPFEEEKESAVAVVDVVDSAVVVVAAADCNSTVVALRLVGRCYRIETRRKKSTQFLYLVVV